MTVLESHVQSPSAPAHSVPTASNGHGTAVGTLPRDPEARLETLFDPGTTRLLTPHDTSGVVVSATKSMTGHLLGGAGAVEAVATILALRDRVAPPTINLDDPDEEARVDIATKPRELAPHGSAPMAALNNSFGFGGHNVTLAFTAA